MRCLLHTPGIIASRLVFSSHLLRYDESDTTVRLQDAADPRNNIWGWDDISCATSLPYICVMSCEWSGCN